MSLHKRLENLIKLICSKNTNKKSGVKLHECTYGYEEIAKAVKTLISTHVTMGKNVAEFEEKFNKKIGLKNSIMSNSGSSANLLILSALSSPAINNHLKEGDEVLVPALSWSTTVWPIIQNKLVPVFIDCDLSTLNMKVDLIEKSITKKTKAIMLVHVYGNSCDMESIINLAKKKNLLIIEDCCEAMGAKYADKYVGTFGIASSHSLYFSHHITSIEGGISSTNNFELAERMRIMRAHGWSRETVRKNFYKKKYSQIDPRFIFLDIGYNLRPTEIQADFAICQLKMLNKIIKKRREAHFQISKCFQKYPDLFKIQVEQKNSESSWFGFAFLVNPKKINKKKFIKFLSSKKIENRPIIAGNIELHPAMKMYNFKKFHQLSNSNYVMRNGVAIGCHQDVNSDQVFLIKNAIEQFVNDL